VKVEPKEEQLDIWGFLAHISNRKYGLRISEKLDGIKNIFRESASYLEDGFLISSDMDWSYQPLAIQVFHRELKMKYTHYEYKSRKARGQGLGELKQGKNDPLFPINHTFAKLRAFQSRLFRRTWNTTKKIENLRHQLDMFMCYHNQYYPQLRS